VSEITDEHMLEMLAKTKSYTLMVLRQGPNYASGGEVAALMAAEPGVQAGVFEYDVHPVRGFPGSALPA